MVLQEGRFGGRCGAASLRSLPCISNSERKTVAASLAAKALTVGAWERVPTAGSFYTWPGSYIFLLAFAPRLRDTGPEQLGFGSFCPSKCSRVPQPMVAGAAPLKAPLTSILASN